MARRATSKPRLVLGVLGAVSMWGCEPRRPLPPAAATNTAPRLSLHLTSDITALRVGQPVDVEAVVEDAEDGATLNASVLWVASVEGQLARGARANLVFQEPGEQLLTASVMDTGGLAASASLALTVLARGAPVATVTRPAPGSVFNLGEVLGLECVAMTEQGVRLSGRAVQWTSALSGPLPTGDVVRATLSVAGEDTLRCTAVDPATGVPASATVRVTVRPIRAPTVRITQPEAAEVFVKQGEAPPHGAAVRFHATAQDFHAEGGPGNLDGAVEWALAPSGRRLGRGPALTHTFTTPGDYAVTARVVDGLGNAAVDSVRVRLVTNLPPRCEMELPTRESPRLRQGVPSTLRATCVDPETERWLAPIWTTNVEPTPLGSGETVNAVLAVAGAQVLSACAVDPDDPALRGCVERPVRVIVNTSPSDCAIQAPLPEAVVNAGVPLALLGSATDAEDARAGLRYTWVSSRDGALAHGPSTTTKRLTMPGRHVLTLTATDPWGLACAATVAVNVNGAPEARIDAVTQGLLDCSRGPCVEGQAVLLTGSARAVSPMGSITELTWLDNLSGNLLTVTVPPLLTATLAVPSAGRHTTVLTAKDSLGAVGRAATSFTVLPPGRAQLLSAVPGAQRPVVAMAQTADGLRYADGASPWVHAESSAVPRLAVDAPARSLFTLRSADDEALFVGTDGASLHRCVRGTCTRHAGAMLGAAVTALAAWATPDVLLLGTRHGLILTRASDPSAGGRAGTVGGRRLLEGREVRQLVISPVSTPRHVTAWAATSGGLAEITLWEEEDFEPGLATVSVVFHTPPAVLDDDVLSVAVGPEGQVFAGTRMGFSALGQPGPALRNAPWGLQDEEVRALHFERQHAGSGVSRDILWAGTKGGLVRYDLTADVVSHFGTEEGLPDPDVGALLVTSERLRYVGTAQGLVTYPWH
ncbi:PKD domain-containing protein [Comamonas sp. JC664]|uniref:PKD domain-containing protein n=1 Tax=Comamonas sp. JC664 TaxID=2801917 RepID=UPI0019202886|nr:PKD domain-containing protein [Comamonas sp. JC664]MBL0697082.1 PKD domain-containing protein [Comamonas sp. JC664]